MGATKTEQYKLTDLKLAAMAKALAHPARVAILRQLAKSKTCMCNDMVLELPLSQPTVSQHLKELKHAGLIKGTVEGTSVCYCINEKAWNDCKLSFSKMFDSLQPGNQCC
jgi:ArsR family transcriptional regulator, lead/cadmium/zinc/bismuth-responsive transcriptional repressor